MENGSQNYSLLFQNILLYYVSKFPLIPKITEWMLAGTIHINTSRACLDLFFFSCCAILLTVLIVLMMLTLKRLKQDTNRVHDTLPEML